ncbi:MAG: hypothetical protein K0B02_03240 [DPANN group archaeon]|nr:hypothetical protein [DPANN group archaeon]
MFTAGEFGIPLSGTMAHSWVISFDSELESFQKYAKTYPDNTIALIDTYDPEIGALNASKLGEKLKDVRLDSGDFVKLSKKVRKILDSNGASHAIITASNDLN